MRLHRNLAEACVSGLVKIFSGEEYSDHVIKNLLKSNPRWGSLDRKFIAGTVYDTVRWWRKLCFICHEEPFTVISPELQAQKTWKVLGVYLLTNNIELPHWKEFEGINHQLLTDSNLLIATNPALRESIPDWLDAEAFKELGQQWDKEITELNKQAKFVIRTNTLKISRNDLQGELKKENVETIELSSSYPDALQIDVRRNIFTTTCFKNGLFEVQDASSQQVAYFMDVSAGMRVIDACAGGGGKSLHIAALMQNRGKIIALDVHEWKLKELQKRAKRAGIGIIETRIIDSSKIIKRLENSADRVLIDAPCSGLGVLRRNPDIKWKLSPQSLDRIREEQLKILSSYSIMTKKNGKLIYVTCSILPSENEAIVTRFLSEHKDFMLEKEKKILPSESGYDGFYMAIFVKRSL